MSAPDRRAKLDRDHPLLSVRRQCAMLGIARSGVYRLPRPANDDDLKLLRRIDELFIRWPFLGSRRMTAMLRAEGEAINRKRVQRLMRRMGIAALGAEAADHKAGPGAHDLPVFAARRDGGTGEPGLGGAGQGSAGGAGGMPAEGADITYIPIGRGFLYLVAVMDCEPRRVCRRLIGLSYAASATSSSWA